MDTKRLAIIVAIGAIIFYGGSKVAKMARGLRNNNPGNIRRSNDSWVGLASEQTDLAFFQFTDPKYGIRAMARIIDNYKKRGIVTVEQIVATWAPTNENDTNAYIDSVYKQTGWPRPTVPVKSEGDYLALIKAIIKHENGLNPYSDETIKAGIAMA